MIDEAGLIATENHFLALPFLLFLGLHLNSVFKVDSNDTPPFDKKLCMFCQKCVVSKTSKVGRPVKDDSNDFQNFIDTCRDHAKYETEKYKILQDEINGKTADFLKSEKYCYHPECRQKFNRDKIYISRKRKAEEQRQEEIRKKQLCPTRILRTDAGSFDYKLCLFCQEEKENTVLHDITQDSRDLELKIALEESPVALQKFKIRSLSAFDAMAGELKYHLDCWNKHVNKRVAEKPLSAANESIEKTSTGNELNLSNTEELMEEDLFRRRSKRQRQSSNIFSSPDSTLANVYLSDTETSLHDISFSESDVDYTPSFICNSTVINEPLDVDTNMKAIVIAEIMSGVELVLSNGEECC